MSYADKYDASPFDPDNPNDAAGEAARQAVLAAWKETLIDIDLSDADAVSSLVGGTVVGIVQGLMSTFDRETGADAIDASIRASLLQVTPWAVDTARAMQELPPLQDDV